MEWNTQRSAVARWTSGTHWTARGSGIARTSFSRSSTLSRTPTRNARNEAEMTDADLRSEYEGIRRDFAAAKEILLKALNADDEGDFDILFWAVKADQKITKQADK